eukprot:TRINITY_DN12475_c0_g9_i3.p1 TRINITY_DN12475_c0_g9~~TRINITY_DN12475_c0_g9_i3.p1  ORF type:complete len:186 (+),score=14.77 TRINITY_DN12475_c0_g9_i3:41-559(+)
MALIYSLVARGNTILAEYTDSSGNFTTVTQNILDKIPSRDQKCTYVYDQYLFHYIREEGIVYLCLADEGFGRRIPFAFLAQISKDFSPYKNGAHKAIAYGYNREFSPVLQRQMARPPRRSPNHVNVTMMTFAGSVFEERRSRPLSKSTGGSRRCQKRHGRKHPESAAARRTD